MELFTVQVGKWRQARNRGIALVDTTVKSGNSIFSPTWDMVLGHKSGSVSDEEYTRLYRERMSTSWKAHKPEWQAFLRMTEPVAIACYCKAGHFCHRYLLRDLLKELCERQNIPFLYYGELE